jgi:Tfp pilus assembly protein PilO
MKQSSKRLWSILLALLFIVAAFICFFDLVQPEYQNVEALRSQQLGETSYLASQTALVKQAQTVLNTYQNAQDTTDINLAMPSGEDVAGALAQIEGIATNNGITIGSIAVTAPEIQVKTGTASTTLMKPLGSFTFNLSASGSYESFKNFLSEIETNIRIFDVKSVSFQPASVATSVPGAKAPATRDFFTYVIVVATYYQSQ